MKEKLKKEILSKKIIILVVFIVFILGLLFGSIYITLLSNSNKKVVLDSVNNYYSNFNKISITDKFNIFKNELSSNLIYYIIMWLLGLSIIGLPIIIFMVFMRFFVTGFNISSLFACYKLKGLKYVLVYLVPSNIILLLLSIFLGIYSVNISIRLATNIIKKKTINFGTFMGKYFFILLISILVVVITSLYDSFVSPFFYNLFTK